MVLKPQTSSVKSTTVNYELPCRAVSHRSTLLTATENWLPSCTRRLGTSSPWFLSSSPPSAPSSPARQSISPAAGTPSVHIPSGLSVRWPATEEIYKTKMLFFSARTACSTAVWRDLAFRIFWNSSDWTRRCSSRLLFSDGSSSSLADEPSEKCGWRQPQISKWSKQNFFSQPNLNKPKLQLKLNQKSGNLIVEKCIY